MTNPDYTAIALLTDRSGSMAENDKAVEAERGIAAFLKEQRDLPGKCTVRVSQFDNVYEVVYESTPVADAADVVIEPRGMTALLDAWGRLITEFGEELAALPEDDRPAHVIFVVVTDGLENASVEWRRERLFDKVTEQTEKYGWQFLYLGADQDAVKVGGSYGVPRGQSMSYTGDAQGTHAAYDAFTTSVSTTRTTGQKTGLGYPVPDEE